MTIAFRAAHLSLAVWAISAIGAGAQEIPRTPTGVPDLSGVFGPIAPEVAPDPFAQGDILMMGLKSRDKTLFAFEADAAVTERGDLHRPLYRPEYWEQVRHLDLNGNTEDPTFSCMPAGPFRQGPPSKIVQTDDELLMLYTAAASGNEYRVIPIDGREPNAFLASEASHDGYSLGRWEGDTLVIETTGFNGEVWLGWPGWLTSAELRVVEELWWQDNALQWKATAYDPILLKPFEAPVRSLTPADSESVALFRQVACQERDLDIFEAVGSNIRG